MMSSLRYCLLAASLFSLAACGGDDTPEQTLPDLASNKDLTSSNQGDAGTDMPTGCPQPSDTCVMNPTTHEGIINACVSGDVVKVDITPFYPAMGYEGCVLPPR